LNCKKEYKPMAQQTKENYVKIHALIDLTFEDRRPEEFEVSIRCSLCNDNIRIDKDWTIQDLATLYIEEPRGFRCEKCKIHAELLKQSEQQDHYEE